jgi:hypothetical protein
VRSGGPDREVSATRHVCRASERRVPAPAGRKSRQYAHRDTPETPPCLQRRATQAIRLGGKQNWISLRFPSVDFLFEVWHRFHNSFKPWRLDQKHVPHSTVVFFQFIQSIFRTCQDGSFQVRPILTVPDGPAVRNTTLAGTCSDNPSCLCGVKRQRRDMFLARHIPNTSLAPAGRHGPICGYSTGSNKYRSS